MLYHKYLYRILAALLAIALLTTPVLAEEDIYLVTDELEQFELPLSGLLAVLLTDGIPYPEETPNDGYLNRYLFYLANILQQTDPDIAPSEEDTVISRVVTLSKDEIARWFALSFADASAADGFVPDGEAVRAMGGDYTVHIGDDYRLSVAYAGAANPRYQRDAAYPYTYSLTWSDGAVRTGAINVSIRTRDGAFDDEYPLHIAGFSLELTPAQEESIYGNWKSDSGAWFSLMEEGFAYLFDAQSQLLENGTFALEDGVLTLTLPSGVVQGVYDASTITIAYPGEAEIYQREVFT